MDETTDLSVVKCFGDRPDQSESVTNTGSACEIIKWHHVQIGYKIHHSQGELTRFNLAEREFNTSLQREDT